MGQRRDTRENPFGGRSYNSPSNMTRVGNSLRFTTVVGAPADESIGVPTQDWKSIHCIFYADAATYTGLTAKFRPWRWYSKQMDGQSGISAVEVGRWIPDYEVVVALDPARITAGISSHLAWPTRDAEKMYFQLLGCYDAGDVLAAVPDFVSVQIFGDATAMDGVSVSVSSVGGPGGAGGSAVVDPALPPFMAGIAATHWSPVNGSAVFASAVTLTTAGFPFIVDDVNCDILGIRVRRASGVLVEFVNGHNGVSISATGDVVTIAGVPINAFAATDIDYYVYLVYEVKAYTEATNSLRTEEIAPLNHEHTQPAYVCNFPAVVADPGLSYAPSADGIIMDGYKDIAFQLYMLGGKDAGGGDETVTVTFQGSNDTVDNTGARVWTTLAVGYDLGTDLTAASWVATGATAANYQVDFDNWEHKRIRMTYDWTDAPDAGTPGALIVTERRKAL